MAERSKALCSGLLSLAVEHLACNQKVTSWILIVGFTNLNPNRDVNTISFEISELVPERFYSTWPK